MRCLFLAVFLLFFWGCASGDNELQVCLRTIDKDREPPWEFQEEGLQKLALYVNETRKTPVPILLEHGATAFGTRAVGFIDKCRVAPEGLFCTFHWTMYGRAEVCTGAWRYVSPNVNGRKTKKEPIVIIPYSFDEISLTNMPRFDGMKPVPIPACIAFPQYNFIPAAERR